MAIRLNFLTVWRWASAQCYGLTARNKWLFTLSSALFWPVLFPTSYLMRRVMMNEFTKGNFFIDRYRNIRCDNSKGVEGSLQISGVSMPMYDNKEIEAKTELVFITFKTATKLAEAGYDAIKVLEVLPDFINLFSHGHPDQANKLFELCRG